MTFGMILAAMQMLQMRHSAVPRKYDRQGIKVRFGIKENSCRSEVLLC
jgi:hypothetical protein